MRPQGRAPRALVQRPLTGRSEGCIVDAHLPPARYAARPRAGLFFPPIGGYSVPSEPVDKRAVAFFDGQNLFHAARIAFGYTWLNYDPKALAAAVCGSRNWRLTQTRFYTGVPDAGDDPFWSHFWTHKLAMLGRQSVHVYSASAPDSTIGNSRRMRKNLGKNATFMRGINSARMGIASCWKRSKRRRGGRSRERSAGSRSPRRSIIRRGSWGCNKE